MIPKKIHYCWFGKGKKQGLIKKCMRTWPKYLEGYEIKEWNEDNFDVHINKYVEEAYNAKKYGYVTDFVRLYALYTEGGIYMDTDVEVCRSLDPFLELTAFTGRESAGGALTATMGSVKGGKWVKDLMDEYADRKFILEDGAYNWKTNVEYTDDFMERNYNVKAGNTKVEIPGYVTIFPQEWFCPKSWGTGAKLDSDDTYTIHHFTATYNPPTLSRKKRLIIWTRYNLGLWPSRVVNLLWGNPLTIPQRAIDFVTRKCHGKC